MHCALSSKATKLSLFFISLLILMATPALADSAPLTHELIDQIRAKAEPVPYPEINQSFAFPSDPEGLVWKFDHNERPIPANWDQVWQSKSQKTVGPRFAADQSKDAGPNRITNTTSFPYSAVVHLYMIYDIGAGSCSGAFVENTHTVVTAAHCLWNEDSNELASEVIIIPAENGATRPLGGAYAYNWAASSAYVNYGDYTQDWGVIQVESFGTSTGYLDTTYTTTSSWYWSTELETAGYPAAEGYPGDQMWWAMDDVIDLDTRMLQIDYAFGSNPYYCIPGQSGSSIFLNDGGNWSATAILTLASCHGVRLNDTIMSYVRNSDCDGCLISGNCYSNGSINPSNICQKCNTGQSLSSWSYNNGVSCDDGVFCNGDDTCHSGTCAHDGDPCDSDETCVEKTDECIAGDDDDDDDTDDDDGDDDPDFDLDGDDCSDLLEAIYNGCDFKLENLSGEVAYQSCKDDDNPWECIWKCAKHPDVNECGDFAQCLDVMCDIDASKESSGGNGDDDDSSGGCGGLF